METAGKGTGLGLSIARALTERLGGSIFAEYEDGSIYIIVEFLNGTPIQSPTSIGGE